MISSSQFLCLFLLACPIFCISKADKITINTQTFEELSQKQLSTSTTGEWGLPATSIMYCPNLSKKYSSLYINGIHTEILAKQFTELQPHNYVYVVFDILMDPVVSKGKIDIDGTTKEFTNSESIFNMNKSCKVPSTGQAYNRVPDFYTKPVQFLLKHSSNSMKISINSTLTKDFGAGIGILGVGNMKIYLAFCGDNASFNISTKACSCDSGYKQSEVRVPVATKCFKE